MAMIGVSRGLPDAVLGAPSVCRAATRRPRTVDLNATSVQGALCLCLGGLAASRRRRDRLAFFARNAYAKTAVLEAPPPPIRRGYRLIDSESKVRDYMNGDIDMELIRGANTGWEDLDKNYRPVPGELTVVTGTPGSGKSEWLLSMCLNLAEKADWRIAVCSFEHKTEDIALKLFEKAHKMTASELHTDSKLVARDSFEDFRSQEKVCFLCDHFDFIGGSFEEMPWTRMIQSVEFVLGQAEASGRRLKGLVIDPYNYVDKGDYRGSETDFVSMLLSRLRQVALRGVHIWLVVHPTKKNGWADKERPSLYDCMGSAHFYNKCDMGLILARDKKEENCLRIHVEKVRNGEAGQIGVSRLLFNTSRKDYIDWPIEEAS